VGALQEAAPIMADALLAGDEDHCSQIVMELFLAKHSVHQICDQVIAEAFKRIGHRWACGEAEIYQERRGCKIAQRILNRLHYLISDIASSAPLAIGCSVEGDYYSLGSTMVELVFRESGWRAMSLGENIPISSLEKAIKKQQPQAVWLSCSYISDPKQFVESYRALRDKHQSALFILGGMALNEEIIQQIDCSFKGSCMKELFEYATKKKLDFA
jgi:methanogenic corrinoid protein MtbC1